MTLATLLPPERLARLVDFPRRDASLPGCEEVLSAITRRVFEGPEPATPRLREIRRAVQAATVRRLLLATSQPAQTTAVRAALEASLSALATSLARGARSGAPEDQALRALLARDIERWLSRPAGAPAPTALGGAAPDPPPGPPIGGLGSDDDCGWPPPVE